jgi:hypothetical protein
MGKTIFERVVAIEKECSGVWGQSGITQWERDRLGEWKSRHSLSPKQEETLRLIERKAFGEKGEE